MTTVTKLFTKLSKNKEIMEMMSIRKNDASGHLIGPEAYRTIFGHPSGDHNILLIREFDVDRKYLPQTIELLCEVKEIGKDEDTKILVLYPIIVVKMGSLFVAYYYSSLEEISDIIDRFGMSDVFQSVVNRANRIGKLKKSNLVKII